MRRPPITIIITKMACKQLVLPVKQDRNRIGIYGEAERANFASQRKMQKNHSDV